MTDLDQIDRLFRKLAKVEDGFGFDIETGYAGPPREKFALHPETAFVVGVSYSGDPSWARYTPLRHDVGKMVDNTEFARLLAPLLMSGKGIAHNGIFELRHLAKFFRGHLTAREMEDFGLEPNGYFPIFSDSMSEAYLLGEWPGVGLKDLTFAVFGHRMTEFVDLFPEMTEKQKKSQRFNTLDLSHRVVAYACEDSAFSLGLSRKHRPRVKDKLLYRVDMGLLPVIAAMEDRGLAIDWASMSRWNLRAKAFADALRAEIMIDLSESVGQPVDINLGSSQQVSKVLYEQMGLRTTRLTDKGAMSTSAPALAGLAKKHPVVKKILDFRELVKLSGSYLEKYPRDFNYADDGRGHPSHSTCFVISGRFSVSDPAYQQLPKKYFYELRSGQTFDLNFRDFIVAAPDHYLCGFDYSQIELRVLAGFSGEPALVKAYNDGIDVHKMTASLVYGIPFDAVTEDQRSRGKTTNFALMYGQGPKGMAERMGVDVEEAKAFLIRYFAVYSSIKSWIDRQTREGVARGHTVSKFGRKHPIWALESDKPAIRANGERLCVNAPIQGSAADIARIAMVRCVAAIKAAGYSDRVHLTMNIHDALVFEVHKSVSPQVVIDLVQPQAVFPVPGWPPMVADWEIGMKWGSMRKLELDENGRIVLPSKPVPVLAVAG